VPARISEPPPLIGIDVTMPPATPATPRNIRLLPTVTTPFSTRYESVARKS
jgi:hypothetical protein